MRLSSWFLALASSNPAIGLEWVCPRKGCPSPWPRIFLCHFVSSTPPLLKSLLTAALVGKEVFYWTNNFFRVASAKELSSIFFAGAADRNPSIRFAAASFFGLDWLNKQPKNSLLSTDSISLSLSPLSLLASSVHKSTCQHVPQ